MAYLWYRGPFHSLSFFLCPNTTAADRSLSELNPSFLIYLLITVTDDSNTYVYPYYLISESCFIYVI